jgi:hypothetical protein
LLDIGFLMLPPFVANMVHELGALYPDGAIPFVILFNPIGMNFAVHFVLQMQHR